MGQKLEEFVSQVGIQTEDDEYIIYDALKLNININGSNAEIAKVCEGVFEKNGRCLLSQAFPLNSCPYISKTIEILPGKYGARICRFTNEFENLNVMVYNNTKN